MNRRIIFLVLIIFFVNAFFVLAANQEELQGAIKKKNEELEAVNSQIRAIQQQLEGTKLESKTLKKEINKLDQQINQLNLNIRASELTIERLNLEIRSLQYDIDDAEAKIRSKKEAIVEILRQLQKSPKETPLTIFLKNQQLSDGVFELQSLTDLNHSLTFEVSELQSLQSQLFNVLQEVTLKQQQIKDENQILKNKKIINESLKKSKQILLTQTKNQEKIYQKQLTELEKQQEAIFNEISKLEEELRKTFDVGLLPSKRAGVLQWPIRLIQDGGTGKISQRYGETTYSYFYKGKPHNGLDIEAPLGTPVYAAADGVVIAVGNNDQNDYRKYQYGKYILIKHENNLATLYAHLSIQVVASGATLKRGDLIGYSGNSGFTTGAHLHFGVYWAPSIIMKTIPPAKDLVPVGVTVDPQDYL